MSTTALDMRLVPRVFRREFANIPGLIAGVPAGDTARAKVVGRHVAFIMEALHNHHVAEDELVWPLLQVRVSASVADIHRMAEQHARIAATVSRVHADLSKWVESPDRSATEQLLAGIDELGAVVVEHLDDEELNAVPLIEEHITRSEWQATVKRAAAFLKSHPRLAIVQGGLVLDYASTDERRTFLAGVPLPSRLLMRLLSPRMTVSYRRRLYPASL
jgi:hemerythrin-like domain-containing protein